MTFRSRSKRTDFLSAPKALEACAIRLSTSNITLPEDSICDPRYGNSFTDSISSSPTLNGVLSSAVTSLPTAMTFVFGMLRVSPKSLPTSMYSVVINSAPLLVVDFSTSWCTVNIISEHPRSLLKSHWDSGSSSSARVCSLSWMILETTFPTVSSKAMPLQLSHLLKSPFFGIRTNKASDQSFGTSPSFHVTFTRSSSSSRKSSSQHAALTISGRMPDAPPAFPFLELANCLGQFIHSWYLSQLVSHWSLSGFLDLSFIELALDISASSTAVVVLLL